MLPLLFFFLNKEKPDFENWSQVSKKTQRKLFDFWTSNFVFFNLKALTLYTFPFSGIGEARFPSHISSIPALCYERKNFMERT